MAFRTWAKLLGVTLGVAALAGACQLGLAYGLGILRLTWVLDVTERDQWTVQLAWVAWFAMTAAVLGALAGRWMRDRWRTPATVRTFGALAVAAGVGAALVVPLTMQPARTARIDGVHPVFVIGLCAGLGAAVGIFAAYAALTQVVARWSLATVGIAIWVLALVSVAPSLTLSPAPDDPLPAVRLGVFDAGFLSSAVTQRAALFTMPALALVVGGLLGYQARRRDLPTLTIALAGLPGPALLTVAYLIAGPGAGPERYQVVPYWAAMTATGAGVLGSVLAAVLRRGGEDPAETDAEPNVGAGRGPGTDGDEPTDRIPVPRPTAPAATAPAATAPAATAPATGSSPTAPPPRSRPRKSPPTSPQPSPVAPPPATPPAKKATRRPPRNTPPSADGETGELPTFNAFANPSKGRSRRRADPAQPAPVKAAPAPAAPAKAEQPYVPAPALPEIPPEALQQSPHRRPVNVDARPENLRGNAPVRRPGGTPMVPEPPAISPPLPHPEPVNKPLSVTPAPTPAKPRGRKQKSDDEYVDWVSKLSNEN